MGEVLAKDLKLGQYMHLAPRKFEIGGQKWYRRKKEKKGGKRRKKQKKRRK
jgi:hypothetical protein